MLINIFNVFDVNFNFIFREKGLRPASWAVITGDSSTSRQNDKSQLRHLIDIVTYPSARKVSGLWQGDAALVRLDKPLTFDKFTQPACLSDDPSEPNGLCSIAYWRSTKGKKYKLIRCY